MKKNKNVYWIIKEHIILVCNLIWNIHKSNTTFCKLIKFVCVYEGHVWRTLALVPAIIVNVYGDDIAYVWTFHNNVMEALLVLPSFCLRAIYQSPMDPRHKVPVIQSVLVFFDFDLN